MVGIAASTQREVDISCEPVGLSKDSDLNVNSSIRDCEFVYTGFQPNQIIYIYWQWLNQKIYLVLRYIKKRTLL